jgi:hypothetical protein
MARSPRKQELDRKRTQWRLKHRTLIGRVILHPEQPPEHVNARASKAYSWFWREMLRLHLSDIPALVSILQDCIKTTKSPQMIQRFRTMIGMAQDCYQLKQLEDIDRFDPEIQLSPVRSYDSEEGVVHQDGSSVTTDYNEEESAILLRDLEGVLRDVFSSEDSEPRLKRLSRYARYQDWQYE